MPDESPFEASGRVLVLLHGIRTRALWQEKLAAEIPQGVFEETYRLKYGRFDILRFWLPTPLRGQPVKRLRRDLVVIRDAHPDCLLTIVAHSYGTYALSKILQTTRLTSDLVILAGAIVPDTFDWTRLTASVGRIINDCGMRDIWPPLAKTTTLGYGATGTYGIGQARVQDRYFNIGHSDFFSRNFVRKYWLPLLTRGKARRSPAEKNRYYTGLVRALGGLFPGALLLIAALLMLGAALVAWSMRATASLQTGPTIQVVLVVLAAVGTLLAIYMSREAWSGRHYECRRVLQRELRDLDDLFKSFFDSAPSRDTVRAIFGVNNKTLFFVDRVARGVRSQKRTHVGCFSLLPLKRAAIELLEREELIGLELRPEHVATGSEGIEGLYIGAIAAKGLAARGYVLAYVEGRLESFEGRELKVFTRPITRVGLRLAEKYGFEPVGGEGEGGLGRLYKRTFE